MLDRFRFISFYFYIFVSHCFLVCVYKVKIESCEDDDEIFTKKDPAQWRLVLVVMQLVVKYSNKLFCSERFKVQDIE